MSIQSSLFGIFVKLQSDLGKYVVISLSDVLACLLACFSVLHTWSSGEMVLKNPQATGYTEFLLMIMMMLVCPCRISPSHLIVFFMTLVILVRPSSSNMIITSRLMKCRYSSLRTSSSFHSALKALSGVRISG